MALIIGEWSFEKLGNGQNPWKLHWVIDSFGPQNLTIEDDEGTTYNFFPSHIIFPSLVTSFWVEFVTILSNILKCKKIFTSFKSPNTIRQIVKSIKYPIDPLHQKGIYKIACSCSKIYMKEINFYIKLKNMKLTYDIIEFVPRVSHRKKHHI